jgi:hypothetical protein
MVDNEAKQCVSIATFHSLGYGGKDIEDVVKTGWSMEAAMDASFADRVICVATSKGMCEICNISSKLLISVFVFSSPSRWWCCGAWCSSFVLLRKPAYRCLLCPPLAVKTDCSVIKVCEDRTMWVGG